MINPILSRTTRGGITDTFYRGAFAVVQDGKVIKSAGDIDTQPVFFRSSSKPLQALSVIASGAADAFGLTDKEIAIIAGSHNAEPEHVETVRGIFKKGGLDESILECGTHPPIHIESRYALCRAGIPFSAIHNNCSGKHAGMLLLAKHIGAPLDATYIKPEHPVQRKNLEMISLLSEYPADKIISGTDGCGVPNFAMPLKNIAMVFARAANPEGLPANLAAACRRVARAMQDNPLMVAGHLRYCTDLLNATGKKFLLKAGANGVYVLGVVGRNMGVAMRNDDGDMIGYQSFFVHLLRHMDLITDAEIKALDRWANMKVLNERKEEVGRVEVVLKL
jgi:L-asparaginase II